MNGSRWVIVDTETDGLYEPIHVVELAAQLMDGWEPVGEPFRMLLNHDVPIPPEAVAIHGYTRDYLRRHGVDPRMAYMAFRDYARDHPIIAHNLSYDWNRCLQPEWERLGIPPIGRRGFCCMMLARRLAPETKSYRLDVLKERFQLTASESHRAMNDVFTVVELFQRVYQPRLESAGFNSFESIAAFAKRTPVAKCQDMISRGSKPATSPVELRDAWYYIDTANDTHGPFVAFEANRRAAVERFYVWREGMADWAMNGECEAFSALVRSGESLGKIQPTRFDNSKSVQELMGICRGLIADDKITTAEVKFLNSWLEDANFLMEWPASELAQTLERILDDGVITKDEKLHLKQVIEAITMPATSVAEPNVEVSVASIDDLSSISRVADYSVVCLQQGTREWLEWRHNGIGASDASAIMGENRFKSVREVLLEKQGVARESAQNAAMARGTMLEPEARRNYIERTRNNVQPACLQSAKHPWLRASVDGLSEDGRAVVEIKCGESVYRHSVQYRSVPDYYYGQLQHVLAITNLPVIDFWCYLPGRAGVLIQVPRDEHYIARLLVAEEEFWSAVKIVR